MIGQHRAKLAINKARESAINAAERVHAERGGDKIVPLNNENFRHRYLLMPQYLDYVARVSWADHAVSIGTAAVLAQLCERHRPARVLDTGSGFSSYVLRRYAAEHGTEVVSVDDDADWMRKTAAYLEGHGLADLGELVLWDDFSSAAQGQFDLIFHDLGTFETRVNTMPAIDDLVAPSGLVVYDDVVIPSIRAAARELCAVKGRDYFSLRHITLDEISRYSALSAPA